MNPLPPTLALHILKLRDTGLPVAHASRRSMWRDGVHMATRTLIVLACGALLAGCEGILDGVYELAFGEDMQITTTNQPLGAVGVPFQWPIYAEVKNDPFDHLYDYDWKLTEGLLPEGLVFSDEGDHALVSGTPMQSGVFDVEVYVSSDRLREKSYAEDSDVLSHWDYEEFTITIQEE